MKEIVNLNEGLSKAESIRKSARTKLRINVMMFFIVYGVGIPLANHLWDSNRTLFYVVVIYMMLNVFLQLFIYIRITSGYERFVSTTLMNQLVALKFPGVVYEVDDSEKKKVISESRLFRFDAALEENDGYFHGTIDGFRFHTFRFYMPFREVSGIFSRINNPQLVNSDVILIKKASKALSGIGELVKELPGVKKLLPEIPELPGVIPELDEYFHIYSETEEAIRTALSEHRVALLQKLAKEQHKLKTLSFSFIEEEIFMYDDTHEALYELPSVKHKLTDSSPDIVFKGLTERVNLLRELRG